ncbi:hypothetical protein, partial [Streptococcus suis]|uniref:hypothetical protein n=1 Tax=Streptococcus suis TaxID=1307 RepID=UPI000CF399F4
PQTTSSISILEISVWASPDSLTSGSLVINELVALDLTNWVFFTKIQTLIKKWLQTFETILFFYLIPKAIRA